MTIKELKSKWKKEQDSYKSKEVGSGVQKFVKDVLKSNEIFGLKEGLISTLPENRKNEFTELAKWLKWTGSNKPISRTLAYFNQIPLEYYDLKV